MPEPKAKRAVSRSAEVVERGVTRRHTFFCVDRKRHAQKAVIVEVAPKTIQVFGSPVDGWIITTEEPVIDQTITLAETMDGIGLSHDPE